MTTRQTMTDEQRKSIALEYLRGFDNKGVTSSGVWVMDRGIPTEEILAEMRDPDRHLSYLVGTRKAKKNRKIKARRGGWRLALGP